MTCKERRVACAALSWSTGGKKVVASPDPESVFYWFDSKIDSARCELFGSSLPRLQRLSMVNCRGLLPADTPVLKVMSVNRTARVDHTGVSVNQY